MPFLWGCNIPWRPHHPAVLCKEALQCRHRWLSVCCSLMSKQAAHTQLLSSTGCLLPRRYVVVTRPVRQGRLKLALEEVLSIHMDTPTFACALLLPPLLPCKTQQPWRLHALPTPFLAVHACCHALLPSWCTWLGYRGPAQQGQVR